jgi:hypothetical protein
VLTFFPHSGQLISAMSFPLMLQANFSSASVAWALVV